MMSGAGYAIKRGVKRAMAQVARLPALYPVCKRLVDLHNGEQESDAGVNGELRFLQQQLGSARVAVDVGANVGDWAACALQARPGLTIHCFEPCAATFELLRQRRLPPSVHLHRFALGDAPGVATLNVGGEGTAGGINSFADRSSSEGIRLLRTEDVEVDTFDRFRGRLGLDAIDFVKIDTEGHEFAVLRGMRESLDEGRVRVVQFEYGGTYIGARVLLLDIWRFVEALDTRYRFYKLFVDGPREVPRYRESLENFQYANYALIRDP